MKFILTLVLSLFLGNIYAQSKPFEKPANYPPSKKKEYIKFKDDFFNAVTWLENTPFDEQKESRAAANAFVVEYLTNSPDVSISLDASVLKFSNKNVELLTIYMGNYARLAFESKKGKQDNTKCAIMGIKSVIKFYKANIEKGLIQDDNLTKLIEADEKGELEKWIKDNGGKQ